MILSKRELLAAYARLTSAIDSALDELPTTRPLDRPFLELRLAALTELRRRVRERLTRD